MMNDLEESSVKKDDSKDAIKLVKDVHAELKAYREPFEKDWRIYDDAYYGKQHKTGEDRKTVKNHIFKIIEGEVPILTDSMPGTQVDADIADKQADAEILDKSIRYVYQDNNLPLTLPTLVRNALTSAPGYLYAFFNPDANGGEGKIEYKQLPWEAVFLDGNVSTIEEAERARIEIPLRRESSARMWPEKREEILGISPSRSDSKPVDNESLEERDISGSDVRAGKPQKFKSKDIIKYVETWVKSYDLEPIPAEETAEELAKEREAVTSGGVPSVSRWQNHPVHIEDHTKQRAEILAPIGIAGNASIEEITAAVQNLIAQNPEAEALQSIPLVIQILDNHIAEHNEIAKLNPKGEREKYKDGWRLIKTAGDIVLYDGGNPEERDGIGHIPIVPFYGYKDNTIYGFGEVKNILDPQRTLNDMDFREFENLKVCGNSGWVADHEAEVDSNDLTNEPGIVVIKKKGTEVTRLPSGQVSPQFERRKLLDAEFIEDASGINRESQGNMASSASGVAITKLQTQAIGRIRLKDRYLQYYSMRRLALITAQLILNHWTEEKKFRLRGDNSSIEDVVFDPIRMSDLGYNITVSPGSMAGLDKDALNAFYLNLFKVSGGAMTFEDLLMVSEFPKKEILLAKIKERDQLNQQIQESMNLIKQLQQENAGLKGLMAGGAALPEDKKAAEIAGKQALMEKMMNQSQPTEQIGVNSDQPSTQGNM